MDFPNPGNRIVVRGLSGSGKTTLSKQLSHILSIPHTELDELFWKPNWEKSTDEEFFHKILPVVAKDCWIICGNYSRCRHLIDPLANTVIWLDYPFYLTLARLLNRSIWRARKKQLLWGHCQETIWGAFAGKDAIVWWIFRYRKRMKRTMGQVFSNQDPSKVYIRFQHPRQTQSWLDSLNCR